MSLQSSPDGFNQELLAIYYERLFPYELFVKWLSYNQNGDFLYRREFSFTLENDVYIRYKAFKDHVDFKAEMQRLQPFKIDLGAVFSISPIDKSKVKDSAFVPVERELVFDIDLTDYDDIRTCCKGATICEKCWKFVVAAVKLMDVSLRDDFGFKNLLWVYSGRRGVHCWVVDELARSLTNEARNAIVQYFTVVEGNENTKRKVILKEPMHPFLQRSVELLEPLFVQYIVAENGQDIFSDPEHWKKILEMIPDQELRKQLDEQWTAPNCQLSSLEKWEQLQARVQRYLQQTSKKRSKTPTEDRKKIQCMRTCIAEIVLSYMYPRLDANVTKQRNHLLKSPFSVHPKTGRICVPINPKEIDTFDPFRVPTLGDLEKEINSNPTTDENQNKYNTSLTPYLHYFQNSFLKDLRKTFTIQRRELDERTAAMTGNW